jgi:hypothetical protein
LNDAKEVSRRGNELRLNLVFRLDCAKLTRTRAVGDGPTAVILCPKKGSNIPNKTGVLRAVLHGPSL